MPYFSRSFVVVFTILLTAVISYSVSDNTASKQLADKTEERNENLSSVVSTIAELRQIKTDSYDTSIPLAAKPLLTSLKHQIRDLIHSELNAGGGRRVEPEY